jgi:DNA repair exonuclease SbcCD ATPase subunit
MSDVKRYSSYNVMMSMEDQKYIPTADGKWVTYYDYAALEARLAEVEADLAYANKRIKHAFERNDRQAQTIDDLTAALADLHGPILPITEADQANIIAHLSWELDPRGPLPNRNSVMMALVKSQNDLKAALARVADVEAEMASGSFYQEKDIDDMQHRAEAAEAALATARRDAVQIKSDAINDFCAKAGIRMTVEVEALPDDVREFRRESAFRALANEAET